MSLEYERRSFCFAGVGLKTRLVKSFTLGPVRLRALLRMVLALISARPWRGTIAMMWVYKMYGRFNRGARVLRRKKTFKVCTGHMAYAYAPWPRPCLLAYYVCGPFLRYPLLATIYNCLTYSSNYIQITAIACDATYKRPRCWVL